VDYLDESTYSATRLPVDLASTLIADAYRSPAFFRDEQQRVFADGWVAVAARSELSEPGHAVVRTVAGRSVIVTVNADGDLRAFLNVCRHRGSQLLDGDTDLAAGRIRCPYHAWAYDLDGYLIGTPLFEGSDIPEDMRAAFDMGDVKAFDRSDYPLFDAQVATWGPIVLVSLSAHPPPLADWLGDLDDRLGRYDLGGWHIRAGKDYDIAANWKLIAENFMEYYHLPWVHPELATVSRVQDHYRYQGPGMYTGMTTTPISGDDSAWLALPPPSTLTGADLAAGRFILLFPNVTLSVLPNHCFLMILEPVAENRTLERTMILTHDETVAVAGAETALAELLAFWDKVNLEDVAIVESVQRGVSTPEYTAGRMCYRFEEPVHRFHNMVVDRMVSLDRIPPGDEVESAPMFE
jgi:choline monooxygenase